MSMGAVGDRSGLSYANADCVWKEGFEWDTPAHTVSMSYGQWHLREPHILTSVSAVAIWLSMAMSANRAVVCGCRDVADAMHSKKLGSDKYLGRRGEGEGSLTMPSQHGAEMQKYGSTVMSLFGAAVLAVSPNPSAVPLRVGRDKTGHHPSTTPRIPINTILLLSRQPQLSIGPKKLHAEACGDHQNQKTAPVD
ncbi:hypothetical protein AC578_3314 [Pseudocercospora eumusae]|uniref:Uncharacterized protein n=1 Tax=Pseudocercospora eumusae TaxID=321146 RepID=A0A139HCF7_9PEZI|nr:hypothetical protein AC578_3314 [Pseudocercospora eumusae]